jgi:FtsZ-binding cell division protein ZapB
MFDIFQDEQWPIETRLKTAVGLLEDEKRKSAALARKKTPPVREEHEKLQEELRQARDTIRSLHESVEVWKEVSAKVSARVDEVKDGTDTARLEREVERYKRLWTNARERLADAIEHRGNAELLEEQLNALERQNAILRNRSLQTVDSLPAAGTETALSSGPVQGAKAAA